MSDDGEKRETIEELVERLIREHDDRTSPDLIAGDHQDYRRAKGLLTACAEKVIIQECFLAEGKSIKQDYMNRRILHSFILQYGWDYSLEVRHNGGTLVWVNAIAWGRAHLADPVETILVPADEVEGGQYLLVRDADERARKKLRERDMLSLRVEKEGMISGQKKTRLRSASEVEDLDAVYIIVDPKRPGSCKVGAGNGNCNDRLVAAKLWTNYEAQLMHVEPVGPGMGLKVEKQVHRELDKDFLVNGEWVQCNFSVAKAVVESLG